MSLPDHVETLIIGAGIHGLSTAWHLAERQGSGAGILVVDKSGIAAGASGIACGVIRNNYYQPAMRELMAHSVDIWESDPKALSYHPVGYLQISPEAMSEDVAGIHREQQAIGYPSAFIDGAADSAAYMKDLFHDWQARGITSVLHEKRGGFANNTASIYGLATKAEALGVQISSGIEVRGFEFDSGATRVSAVETNRGTIRCEQVVVAVGPWISRIWDFLELPRAISVTARDGKQHQGVPMWHYMALEEGTLDVDPEMQRTNDGGPAPVIHVDTDAPLHSDVDGSLVSEKPWGIYYKPDTNFGGIQGGSMPSDVNKPAEQVAVDPYGPASPEFVVDESFAHKWCSALAFCQKRFAGLSDRYKNEASGGLGCFTPDSFPIFDRFRENVTVIADSNHGYKLIGVGKLIAGELVGERSALLEPFRFSRYANGKLHPTSNSPFPWS